MIHLVRDSIDFDGTVIRFNSVDSHYLSRVRRLLLNDEISVFCDGTLYNAVISDSSASAVVATVFATKTIKNPIRHITLVLSVGERKHVEIAVKNGVEAGAHTIVLTASERSNMNMESFQKKEERLHAIILSAASQSRRLYRPLLRFVDFSDTLLISGRHLVFHPTGTAWRDFRASKDNMCVHIGPEGGFTDSEIKRMLALHFDVHALPLPVLRMENGVTAGLTAVACITDREEGVL